MGGGPLGGISLVTPQRISGPQISYEHPLEDPPEDVLSPKGCFRGEDPPENPLKDILWDLLEDPLEDPSKHPLEERISLRIP